jgi:MSHA biogenesis protein MshI
MGWIRTKRKPGWLAFRLHEDRVDLVHVQRGTSGRPRVTLCESYRKEGSDTATLVRLSKRLKLRRYRCTTVLGRNHYQLHQLDAPNVPREELKAAVRWRVRDIIDYPLEGATVDVLDIPADSSAPAPERAVYAVTAPNAAIASCAEPYHGSSVSLEAIDIVELAQRNIAALFEPEGRGVAMLAFYDDEGLLTFTRGGELYSARRIEITMDQLVNASADRRLAYFERIALEVQRSLDHLGRQYHYVPLVKLLLGPLPSEPGLRDYLEQNINVPVETIDLAAVLDVESVPELKDAMHQARYLQGIGAALREEGVPS